MSNIAITPRKRSKKSEKTEALAALAAIGEAAGIETPAHIAEEIASLEGVGAFLERNEADFAVELAEYAEEVKAEREAPTEEEQLVSDLEACGDETVSEAPAEEVQEPEAPVQSFEELRNAVDQEEAKDMAFAITGAMDNRTAFETVKHGSEHNIHRTIKSARAAFTDLDVAKVFVATSTDPEVFNRVLHDGARYNVYAILKVADVAKGLADKGSTNAINLACMRSLFRFKAAGVAFTGEMARAAASDKIRVDAAVRKHLISHTVSASTAPTQASSTMQALETLGVVKVVGSRKNPTYEVLDTPAARHLEALYGPAPEAVAA